MTHYLGTNKSFLAMRLSECKRLMTKQEIDSSNKMLRCHTQILKLQDELWSDYSEWIRLEHLRHSMLEYATEHGWTVIYDGMDGTDYPHTKNIIKFVPTKVFHKVQYKEDL